MTSQLRQQLDISRQRARELAHETVEILRLGHYTNRSGTRVDISEQVDRAVRGTVSYPPTVPLPGRTSSPGGSAVIEVENETTLNGVRELQARGLNPAALNFASAESPGGGFLNGARAQEEYLARSSALWACLHENPMYAFHRGRLDPFYSDYVIYSPNVPVLRDDDGRLLDAPYPCSMITSPAVHAKGVRRYMPDRVGEISSVMWTRILKVLAVAQKHGHRSLILGAWGCGAFGNDGTEIAGLFRRALGEDFRGAFEHVRFSITDWSDERRFIRPFKEAFE